MQNFNIKQNVSSKYSWQLNKGNKKFYKTLFQFEIKLNEKDDIVLHLILGFLCNFSN